MTRAGKIARAAVIVASLASCGDTESWQPYYVPNGDHEQAIVPTSVFPSLLECQQYLVARFGNLRAPGTMSCFQGCKKSNPSALPSAGALRLGVVDCPAHTIQIVGQTSTQ